MKWNVTAESAVERFGRSCFHPFWMGGVGPMQLHTLRAKSFSRTVKPRPVSTRFRAAHLRLIIVVLLAALLLAACGGSDAPTSDAEEGPSAADTATPVTKPDPTDTPEPAPTDTPMPEPTDTPAPEAEATDTPEPEPEAAPAATAPPQEETAAESAASPGVGQTFVIVAEESEARYIIDEELLGRPKTVVGVTNAIAGELTVDPSNPAASSIGLIQIEAGTFATDSNRRDGAVRRFVLQTSQYQFITFTATEYVGLPDTAAIGEEIQFEVTGDLTVRDISRPVMFIVTMQIVSESELRGSAATIIVRDDYELRIPDVPSVANVGEEFIVEFDFVARAQ